MDLTRACTNILDQLAEVVHQIDDVHFSQPVEALSMSTVGQHIRHTLEFFVCLEQGINSGLVNYDKRPHDKLAETDKSVALEVIDSIRRFVKAHDHGKALRLEVGYGLREEEFIPIDTNFSRELVYNIEHAVHHMALIKIGVREAAPYVQLPPNFGIAASTVRYKESVGPAN